jgi:hypothetical protein
VGACGLPTARPTCSLTRPRPVESGQVNQEEVYFTGARQEAREDGAKRTAVGAFVVRISAYVFLVPLSGSSQVSIY